MGSLGILFKNTSSMMFASYFGMGVNFIFTIILARHFGAEGLGIFMTAMTFAFFGSIITDFGIKNVFVRNVSRNKSDLPLYFVNGLFVALSTALVSWIGIAIVVYFLGYNAYLTTIILVSTSTLCFSALSSVCISTITALERMELISIDSIICVIVYSLIGVLIVVLGYSILILVVWGLIVEILNGIALFLVIKRIKRIGFSWNVKPSFCLSILKQSAPIGILRALNVLTNKVDILMLSAMVGNSPVGFYGVAVRIVNFLLVPSGSLNNAILPHFSVRLSSSKDDVKRIYDEIVRVLILLSFPIAIIIATSAESVVILLFGQSFVDHGSAEALKILIWSFFFDTISGPAAILIISLEHRLMSLVCFAGALTLLNVVVNIFMIPAFGIIGASISTLICSLIRFILLIVIVYKVMSEKMKIFGFLLKPSICAVLNYAIIFTCKDYNMVISIFAGLVVYVTSLFMLKALTNEDLSFMKKLVLIGAGKGLKLKV